METDELLLLFFFNFFTKEKWPHRLMVPKEEKRKEGRNELVQINIHTLLSTKASTRDPVHSTRNPPQPLYNS